MNESMTKVLSSVAESDQLKLEQQNIYTLTKKLETIDKLLLSCSDAERKKRLDKKHLRLIAKLAEHNCI